MYSKNIWGVGGGAVLIIVKQQYSTFLIHNHLQVFDKVSSNIRPYILHRIVCMVLPWEVLYEKNEIKEIN